MDDAADIVAVFIHYGDGGGGAHVDDDDGQGILRLCSHGVHNEVRAHLLRVVHPDVHSCLHAGTHELQVFSGDLPDSGGEDRIQGRDDAGQDRALHAHGIQMMDLEDVFDADRVLQVGLPAVGSDPFHKVCGFFVNAADHDVGITHVDCEYHRISSFPDGIMLNSIDIIT